MPLTFERLYVLVRRVWQEVKTKNRLFAMLPITLLIATIVPIKPETITSIGEKSDANLVFSADLPRVVEIKNDVSKIIPGESATGREARLKAEQLAAQKAAEAEAEAAKAAAEAAKVAQAARNTVSREARPVYTDPSDFGALYERAGNAFGVDPRLLRAVHTVETGASGSTSRSSYAGAVGPMQFLPSTWKRYGVDGNGDGRADITNVEDAIFTAAKYLKACGYPDVKKALWGYNPSASYYNKVMGHAHNFGM